MATLDPKTGLISNNLATVNMTDTSIGAKPPIMPSRTPTDGVSLLGIGGGVKAPLGQEYGATGALQPMATQPQSPDLSHFGQTLDASTGKWSSNTQYTSDGKPFTTDASGNVKWGEPNATGVSSGTNQDTVANNARTINNIDSDRVAAHQKFMQTMDAYQNGVIPLTSGEQAQVSGIQQMYQDLVNSQTTANAGAAGQAQVQGYRMGAAEGSPFNLNTIGAIVDAGQEKITSLNIAMASAVAALTNSFKTQDMAATKAAWDEYNSFAKERSDTLQKNIDKAQAAIKDAQDRADTLKKQEQDRKDKITESIDKVASDAANNGASPEVLAAINGAKNPTEALKIAAQSNVANSAVFDMMAKYPDAGIVPGDSVVEAHDKIQKSSSYTADQKSKSLDNAYKQAQIAKAYADAAKARATVNDAGDTVQSLAQQLVDGTLAPSELSKRATGTGSYNAVLTAAGKMTGSDGKPFNIAKADRDYKFANTPATQNTLKYLVSLVGGPNQTGNLDELKTISDSIDRTNFPALNDVTAWAKLASGDVGIAQYQTVATEVADQVAKILQGGTSGGGTSDAKLQQASNMFKTSFTKDQLNGIVESLRPLLANRAKSMIGSNVYLKDYADTLGTNTNIKDQIKTAQDQGHSPDDIINFLSQDGSSVKDKVLQAQNNNYSSQEILDYLQK